MESEIQKARRYCLRLLGRRAYSVAEVRAKLKAHEFSQAAADQVLGELIQKRLLDDAAFARMYAGWRLEGRPMALSVVRRELQKKGVDRDCIDRTLAELDAPGDEEARCLDLARRRVGRLARLEKPEMRQRLLGFLSRRGFSYDTIDAAVRKVLGELETDEDQ